jgi:glycosyltransferase involved in cell wall biosynthesis
MPLISFVCPNRNKAIYLPDAIRTLRNQTLEDIEVIIVDDDSSDDSRDIIDTFANKDKRIVKKYLEPIDLPVDERIDRARNIGNQIASSDIICVTDSDDWYMPERAQITYEKFKENSEYGMFYSSYLQRNRFGEIDKTIPSFIEAIKFSKRRLKRTGLFCIGHFTVGYKKELILKYPYNSLSGVGDWGMFYNLLIKVKTKTCYVDKPLCIYRVYANSFKRVHESILYRRLVDLGIAESSMPQLLIE